MNSKYNVALMQRFGMANQLAEIALDSVEQSHAIDLGRSRLEEAVQETYLPQFDNSVRREAAEMSRHYEMFYCLEKTIRNLISDTISTAEGSAWWDSARVPARLKTEVESRIQRETDSAVTLRSDEAIDYTTFGELGELIKSNWDLFGSIFSNSSARAVERVLANLNVLRGPIAHCSRLAGDEVVRLELSVRDWFRLMA
ncbi:Swt1 family HEPN domain-containing protein [Xanthomonas campestris]|uniref:Swt1 family HEPN domain-containing protein n=1 Tax=Xanthomonas campestris TaxID=339 RepID=UPI003CF53954